MKKLITLLAATVMAVLPVPFTHAAQPESPGEARQTQEYKVRNFDGLDVSWIYKVDLTRANRYSVSIDAPDFIIPYLQVDVRDGVLCLEVRDMPRDIRRKIENGHNEVRASVSMPELLTLKMSGATSLSTQDEFLHRNDKFTLRLSGASSKFDLKGDFDRVDLGLSGAANGQLEASPKVAELEMSGSAKLKWNGKAGKVGLTASGAAGLNFEGSATELRLIGSGAARINAAMAPARDVSVSLSGAAKCDVDVRESLDANLSGAASCRYHATDAVRVTTHAVSRGASLTRY